MLRRSSRLSDQTDEDGNVSKISYKESPWRHNKRRRTGAHKAASPAPATVLAPAPAVPPRVSLAPAVPPRVSIPPPSLHTSSGGLSSQVSQSSTDTSGDSSADGYRRARTTTASCAGALFNIDVRKAILLLLLLTFGVWYSTFVITLPSKETEMADLRAEHTSVRAITAVLSQEMRDLKRVNTFLRQRVESLEGQTAMDVTAVINAALEDNINNILREIEIQKHKQILVSEEMADLRAEHTSVRAITAVLSQEMRDLKRVNTFLRQRVESLEGQTAMFGQDCSPPMAERMPDFALESQGASVVSSRCSETYHFCDAWVPLFGYLSSKSPRTVIQGHHVLQPGKCWPFHGAQGSLVIALSHPVLISHVTLDHLPRFTSPTGRIDSAPKDFQVYGMSTEGEEGRLLGTFIYDQAGESIQTFKLPDHNGTPYRYVELAILSNWGHLEYTCVYRFRVHGQIASL